MLEYMAYDSAAYEDETTISFNRVGVVVIIILLFYFIFTTVYFPFHFSEDLFHSF